MLSIQNADMIKCQHCGKQIPYDANLCPYCGKSIKQFQQKEVLEGEEPATAPEVSETIVEPTPAPPPPHSQGDRRLLFFIILPDRRQIMSRFEQYEARTKELLVPILDELGIELYDVEFLKEGGNYYLRVFIEKEGGVTIGDCEAVSRRMDPLLDQYDYVAEEYIFEVSSPGLGRVLKRENDYIRSIGKEVEIKTYRAIDKQKEFSGILDSYSADTVTIIREDESTQVFDKKDIALIRLAVRF